MIKIEKNISIERSGYSKRGELTELFNKMDVGDSFVYPLERRNTVCTRAKQIGFSCTTRKISSTEVRVWRTE